MSMKQFIDTIFGSDNQGAEKLASNLKDLPAEVLYKMAMGEEVSITEDEDEEAELLAKFAAAVGAGQAMAGGPIGAAPKPAPAVPPIPPAQPMPPLSQAAPGAPMEAAPMAPPGDPGMGMGDEETDDQTIIGAAVKAAAEAGKKIGEESNVSDSLNSQEEPVLPAPAGAPQPVAAAEGGMAKKSKPPKPASADPVKTASVPLTSYASMLQKTADAAEIDLQRDALDLKRSAIRLGVKAIENDFTQEKTAAKVPWKAVGGGAALLAAGGGVGGVVGHSAGKEKGLRTGARKGYAVGTRVGARMGMEFSNKRWRNALAIANRIKRERATRKKDIEKKAGKLGSGAISAGAGALAGGTLGTIVGGAIGKQRGFEAGISGKGRETGRELGKREGYREGFMAGLKEQPINKTAVKINPIAAGIGGIAAAGGAGYVSQKRGYKKGLAKGKTLSKKQVTDYGQREGWREGFDKGKSKATGWSL